MKVRHTLTFNTSKAAKYGKNIGCRIMFSIKEANINADFILMTSC